MQRRSRPWRRLRLALVLPALALLTAQIVLALPPTASFTIPDTAVRGQTISFVAEVTDPEGDTIDSYAWDFGDGTTASGQNVNHEYSTLGTKTVTLRVTDSANEATEVTDQVTVENRLPTASFTPSNTTPARGETVTFTATASDPDGDTLSYAWNFGDGTTGTGQNPSHEYSTLGTKTVTLTVTDSANGTTVATPQQVTVQNRAPNASFTVSNATPARGQAVTFNASVSSDPDGDTLSYAWNFGDGTTGTDQTPSHTYPANTTLGAKTVTLTVTDPANGTDTATQQVTVQNAPPIPVISVSDTNPDFGETVNFNGSASSDFEGPIADTDHDWDLDGNGSFESTGKIPPSRSYSAPGPVTVRLQVRDSDGATAIASQVITVSPNVPPTAVITASHVNVPGGTAGVDVGETVNFDGSTSTAGEPGDTITRYDWDLDGNGSFESTGQTPSRSYSTAGPVNVRLQVTDLRAGTDPDPATHTVTVANKPPTAAFTISPLAPFIGETVDFSAALSSPGESSDTITKYEWDLDGKPATGPQGFEVNTGTVAATSRSYSSAGTVEVRLRVTDGANASHVVARDVLVQNTVPTGSFGFAPDAPLPGQAVTFNGSASSPTGKSIAALEWNFDFNPAVFDAARDQFVAHAGGESVTWSFPTAGPRTVALKVSEVGGGFRIITGSVVVNTPPSAGFSVSDQSPFVGFPVTFYSTSQDPDGPLTSQQWDLDNDGQFDDAAGPVAFTTFSMPGDRTVRLRVTDSRGASSIAASGVRVRALPPPPPPPPPQLIQGVVVRIKGAVLGRYTKVQRLLVQAPQGADVRVRCVGKSCPKKGGRASRLSKGRQLRFKQLERRMRSGTRITVQVTRTGSVGRVTTFKMRTRAAPKRTDLCLPPGMKKAVACLGF